MSLQAQMSMIKAQHPQMTANIDKIGFERLTLQPSESAAKLHWQRFCALSESSEPIVGQDEQLRGLLSMVADGKNKRNVFIITGTPGMVRHPLLDVEQG